MTQGSPAPAAFRVVFLEGTLEARELRAELLRLDPDTGTADLRVTPPDAAPFTVHGAPYHPDGRPGYWTYRAPVPPPGPAKFAPAESTPSLDQESTPCLEPPPSPPDSASTATRSPRPSRSATRA